MLGVDGVRLGEVTAHDQAVIEVEAVAEALRDAGAHDGVALQEVGQRHAVAVGRVEVGIAHQGVSHERRLVRGLVVAGIGLDGAVGAHVRALGEITHRALVGAGHRRGRLVEDAAAGMRQDGDVLAADATEEVVVEVVGRVVPTRLVALLRTIGGHRGRAVGEVARIAHAGGLHAHDVVEQGLFHALFHEIALRVDRIALVVKRRVGAVERVGHAAGHDRGLRRRGGHHVGGNRGADGRGHRLLVAGQDGALLHRLVLAGTLARHARDVSRDERVVRLVVGARLLEARRDHSHLVGLEDLPQLARRVGPLAALGRVMALRGPADDAGIVYLDVDGVWTHAAAAKRAHHLVVHVAHEGTALPLALGGELGHVMHRLGAALAETDEAPHGGGVAGRVARQLVDIDEIGSVAVLVQASHAVDYLVAVGEHVGHLALIDHVLGARDAPGRRDMRPRARRTCRSRRR